MPELAGRGQALGAFFPHLLKTLELEEKETIEISTKEDHVVKQAHGPQNMVEAPVVTPHETDDKIEEISTPGTTNTDQSRSPSTTIPSSLPQKFVAKVFSPQPPPTGSIQAKTLKKITRQ